DPRDFGLIAFGGAGPLHACTLASLLGIRRIVIPPAPGVLSTFGLLATDLRDDSVQTFTGDLDRLDAGAMQAAYTSLEAKARTWLADQGIGGEDGELQRSADLRYRNQGWELTVPVPAGDLSQDSVDEAVQRFHELHRRLYT